jgi:predicted nucleic acid-binding Zn ribbon protein
MERAAKSLAKLKAAGVVSPDDLARAAWPVAVGKRLADRTQPVRMVRATLIVEVEDAVWQRQLHQMRGQILARIRQVIGEDIIQDLEFRIGVPRRPPQMASSPREQQDAVNDPVLRMQYDRAKKKAIS